jgi:hypothetical protein
MRLSLVPVPLQGEATPPFPRGQVPSLNCSSGVCMHAASFRISFHRLGGEHAVHVAREFRSSTTHISPLCFAEQTGGFQC